MTATVRLDENLEVSLNRVSVSKGDIWLVNLNPVTRSLIDEITQ